MKRFLALAASLSGIAAMAVAQDSIAQVWPSKSIRLILPLAAGSALDTVTRGLAQALAADLGQTLVVDNRSGVDMITGTEACAKSPPDGYTFCITAKSVFAYNPQIYRKLPYDPDKDFAPVTNIVNLASVITVHPSLKVNSLKELVALAAEKPGVLNYASMGPATTGYMTWEWIKKKNNVDLVHVPFKSPPQLVQAVVSGEVQTAYFSIAGFLGHIRSGRLKALAVSSAKRSPLLPDVPTLAEAGVSGLHADVWFGMLAPAGTPRDTVVRLQRAIARVIALAEFREKFLLSQGWDPIAPNTPDEFAREIEKDRAEGAELVKLTGARIE